MLKRITILIITILFAMTALSGCIRSTDNVVSDIKNALTAYWKDYSKDECKQLVADALEETYGEEFVVVDIGTKSAGSYYSPGLLTATCHPKNDDTLYFEAEYFEHGSGREISDTFIESIIRKQLKTAIDPVLAEVFDEFATEINIHYGSNDGSISNPYEVAVESFSEAVSHEPEYNYITMWLILEEDNIKTQEEMIEILSGFTGEFHNMRVGIDICYVPKDVLEKCKELTNTTDHKPTDIRKLVGSKYLLHEYSFNGETQTIRYLREIDYEELKKSREENMEDHE